MKEMKVRSMKLTDDVWDRAQALRQEKGWTWDQMLDRSLEALKAPQVIDAPANVAPPAPKVEAPKKRVEAPTQAWKPGLRKDRL